MNYVFFFDYVVLSLYAYHAFMHISYKLKPHHEICKVSRDLLKIHFSHKLLGLLFDDIAILQVSYNI